ncbi:MAG: type II 3-dehydroquinate dehydratase [Candidatus Poribacteria bacterium]|nr:type II 3-dehydroquinate dehydratase [Candidatus Poribacteria bacterium]
MTRLKHVLLIHGPNLQLLGRRRTEVYGTTTLEGINARAQKQADEAGLRLTAFQANSEGDLVDFIGRHLGEADGAVINPAAYTHTSVALRDALEALEVPVIEVHLSNIGARESFRRHSYIAPIAVGSIAGFGAESYRLALDAMIHILCS